MKKIFFAASLFFAALAPAIFVQAADFLPITREEAGNVAVGSESLFHNLYVGGGSVIINSTIFGDLFSAGGSVNIAGSVEKDLVAVGGNISVSGPIGEDARIAGGNVSVNAPIGGDLLLAGGTLSIAENAPVSGDLWVAGGIVNMTNSVAGEARIAGGEIFINGTIEGPLFVKSEKLTFGPNARVMGPITFEGREDAFVQDGAQIGGINYVEWQKWKAGKRAALAGFGFIVLIKFLGLLLSAIVLLKLFRKSIRNIAASAYRTFWQNLGIGIAALIAIPIIAIILCATMIGAYLGMLLGLLGMLLAVVAIIIMVVFLGSLIERLFNKNKEMPLSWKTPLIGAIVGTVLAFIPIIGWLALAILFITVFGAIIRDLQSRLELK